MTYKSYLSEQRPAGIFLGTRGRKTPPATTWTRTIKGRRRAHSATVLRTALNKPKCAQMISAKSRYFNQCLFEKLHVAISACDIKLQEILLNKHKLFLLQEFGYGQEACKRLKTLGAVWSCRVHHQKRKVHLTNSLQCFSFHPQGLCQSPVVDAIPPLTSLIHTTNGGGGVGH